MSHTIEVMRSRTPMWVYEQNYKQLVQVLNALLNEDCMTVSRVSQQSEVIASLLETTPYSHMIEMKEKSHISSQHVQDIVFKIRLYHDAKVAEVVSYQDHIHMKGKYEYPNPSMYQPKEKRQANYLLADWLRALGWTKFDVEPASICT